LTVGDLEKKVRERTAHLEATLEQLVQRGAQRAGLVGKPLRFAKVLIDQNAFVRRHREGPFFLYLPHFAVHAPHQAKRNWIDHFKAKPGDIQEWRNLGEVDVIVMHFWVEERMPIVAFDPGTGEVLDTSMTEKAQIRVDSVKEKLSICTVKSGNAGSIRKGMMVKLP